MPVQMTIHADGADIVRQGLEDLSREIPRIGRQRIYEALRHAQGILKSSKSRPGYPIQWDSIKQRKAFFATGGFGRGIPTRRTGASNRWSLVRSGEGWELSNPADWAGYLYGHYDGGGQSRIFQADYPLFAEVVENEITALPDDIEQNITWYGRGLGF